MLMLVLVRVRYDAIDRALEAAGHAGMGRTQAAVFESLDDAGTRVTVMAERARITKQAMGELVDDLESRGYVRRRSDPTDGRAKLVVLTAKGRRVARAARNAVARLDRTWAAHLGARRASQLRDTLVDLSLSFGGDHLRPASGDATDARRLT